MTAEQITAGETYEVIGWRYPRRVVSKGVEGGLPVVRHESIQESHHPTLISTDASVFAEAALPLTGMCGLPTPRPSDGSTLACVLDKDYRGIHHQHVCDYLRRERRP